jgi:hypothetical protein
MGYWSKPRRTPVKQKQCKSCSDWEKFGFYHRCKVSHEITDLDYKCNMCDHDEIEMIDQGYTHGKWYKEQCQNCWATRIYYISETPSTLGD